MHNLLYVKARSLDFARGGSLTEELKHLVEKMSFFRQRGGQTGAIQSFHRRGACGRSAQPPEAVESGGEAPSPGRFFGKSSRFGAI